MTAENPHHDQHQPEHDQPASTGADHSERLATPADDQADYQPGDPCLICGQPSPAVICPDCAAVVDAPPPAQVCTQCGEPARPVPAADTDDPDDADRPEDADHPEDADRAGPTSRVGWSHADGTPLCPIRTKAGELLPGRPEPAVDWPTTTGHRTERSEPSSPSAGPVSALAALTEVLIEDGFIPDDDDPAAESAIVAERGPLRVYLRRGDGLTVDLYGLTRPGTPQGWSARFSPGTPIAVIAAAIRAALGS
jgi:hypothetical protein